MKLQGQDMLLVYMAAICTCMVLAQDLRVDPRIAQNIEEGEKLIDQLESLLNDPTIHQQDKMDLTSSVDALVRKEKVFGAIQPLMAMSASGRSSFTDMELFSGSSGGSECDMTCCKVVPPLVILSSERTVYHTCWEYYTHHYSQSCGLFGWARCGASRVQSRTYQCASQKVEYRSEQRSCPSTLYTCCEGLVWYKECCLRISELRDIIEKMMDEKNRG